MGIPGFFYYIKETYPDVVVSCNEKERREVDHLYLDMNGIIHPCSHPENKPAPATDEDKFQAIFEYIGKLMKVVKPKCLLYLAVDGVAPRAKMNQQRGRRFLASSEGDGVKQVSKKSKRVESPPQKPFDKNSITPGTSFMQKLSSSMKHYIREQLKSNELWKNIAVIFSDSSRPGEGEHKIQEFIRTQKCTKDYAVGTRHCLYGADADLILLGLATHEKNFIIIREAPKNRKSKKASSSNVKKNVTTKQKDRSGFVFIKLEVLRNHLFNKISMDSLPFHFDLERALDDFILLCCLIGNDFLPNLPSLDIGQRAIETLIELYKKAVQQTGGFLTTNGEIDLKCLQLIFTGLAKKEGEILIKKQDLRTADLEKRRQNKKRKTARNVTQGQKRKRTESETEKPQSDDNQKLKEWETKFRKVYYQKKLKGDGEEFRQKLAAAYIEGLCWVLKYYFQLKPLEQLMAVLPASSKSLVPKNWRILMTNQKSPIRDFYSSDVKIDMNGKRFAHQGICILPFVDQNLLTRSLYPLYEKLTEEEKIRNISSKDMLYIRNDHQGYEHLSSVSKYRSSFRKEFQINPKKFNEIGGIISVPRDVKTSTVSPLSIENIQSSCFIYRYPVNGNLHSVIRL